MQTKKLVEACMKRKGFDYEFILPPSKYLLEDSQIRMDPRVTLRNLALLSETALKADNEMIAGWTESSTMVAEERAGRGASDEEWAALDGAIGGPSAQKGCLPEARESVGEYLFPRLSEAFYEEQSGAANRLRANARFRKLDESFRRCSTSEGVEIPSMLVLYLLRTAEVDRMIGELFSSPPEDPIRAGALIESRDKKIVDVYVRCASPVALEAVPLVDDFFARNSP